MSLAYKLWKIGDVLSEKDMKDVIKIDPAVSMREGEEPEYINLDFKISADQKPVLSLKRSSIEKDRMFFTKKLGGSGGGIYYLYPNLEFTLSGKKNESVGKKLSQLIYTMKNSVLQFSENRNKDFSQTIIDFFDDHPDHEILAPLGEINTGYFWFWISINGETLPEIMPEVWLSWHNNPAIKFKEADVGYDIFTNRETMVGYRPEFKIFSYDQYHDSLNYRVKENLPLSLESAGNIKLAWIYILKKLVFSYKGLQYVIIPNMISDDKEAYQEILKRLVRANRNTKGKYGKLGALRKEEQKLKKSLEKMEKRQRSKKKNIKNQSDDITKVTKTYAETVSKIAELDTGLLTEFNEQADHLGELKHSVTLDFIFTLIDWKTESFEVKGAIEDVVPSRLSTIVESMREFGIEDNITLKDINRDKVYLQDYFNRDELYFALNKSRNKKDNNKNSILQERLHLARLLLTEEKISMEDLLNRFEFHREFDYAHKKKIKDGIKDWINYPETYGRQESTVMVFFRKLKKIKE